MANGFWQKNKKLKGSARPGHGEWVQERGTERAVSTHITVYLFTAVHHFNNILLLLTSSFIDLQITSKQFLMFKLFLFVFKV